MRGVSTWGRVVRGWVEKCEGCKQTSGKKLLKAQHMKRCLTHKHTPMCAHGQLPDTIVLSGERELWAFPVVNLTSETGTWYSQKGIILSTWQMPEVYELFIVTRIHFKHQGMCEYESGAYALCWVFTFPFVSHSSGQQGCWRKCQECKYVQGQTGRTDP